MLQGGLLSNRRAVGFRLIGEFLIIVAGVLVAFQVDAWAEDRRDRDREQAHLQALMREFEENVRRLDGLMADQRRTLSATGQTLALADGQMVMVSPDSLRELTVWTASYQRFEPVLGAFQALTASGAFTLIENEELRVRLASFAQAATDGYEDQPISDLLRAELARRISEVLPWWRVVPGDYLAPFGYADPPERTDPTPLFRDNVYLTLVLSVGFTEAGHLGYFETLTQDATRILTLIDHELAK